MADKGSLHELRDIPEPVAEVAGHLAPAGMGLVAVLLGENGFHNGSDHGLVGLAHAGQKVALEVNPASLPACAKDFACGGLQALMGVADHHLHAPQAAPGQGAEEVGPEW
jgi:hypothetical protein